MHSLRLLRGAVHVLHNVRVAALSRPSTPAATPDGTPTPPEPQGDAEPPANVNLQGFPLEYRQGYADGCASARDAERKDAARFKSDGQYRTGWQDGIALCKKP